MVKSFYIRQTVSKKAKWQPWFLSIASLILQFLSFDYFALNLVILIPTKDMNQLHCYSNSTRVAVDGNWGDWFEWDSCTAQCGGGSQTHARLCNNPEPSNGGLNCSETNVEYETRDCNQNPCSPDGNLFVLTGFHIMILDNQHILVAKIKLCLKIYKLIFFSITLSFYSFKMVHGALGRNGINVQQHAVLHFKTE